MKKLIIIFILFFSSQVYAAELYHYKLNDNTSNTTVTDAMGTNNGIASGNTSTFHVTGKINGAFQFSGSNYVSLGTSKFNITEGAISFWLVNKGSDTGGRNTIVGRGTSSNIDFSISTCISAPTCAVKALSIYGGANYYRKDVILMSSVNNGDHIIINFNADGTANVYINNVLVTPIDTLSGFTWNYNITNSLSIARNGSDTTSSRYFKGTIDDLRFYSHTLSEAERNSIYNAGNGTESAINTTAVAPIMY